MKLTHRRIHAEDAEECANGNPDIGLIERNITLSGPLDREQRLRLLEIADRCPVHRTLIGKIKILTRPSD